MDQERKQVLEMVRDGKLSVEEAQKILDAMNEGDERMRSAASPRRSPRFLRIRVKDEDGSKVNLNIPLSLAKVMMRFVPGDVMGRYQIRIWTLTRFWRQCEGPRAES